VYRTLIQEYPFQPVRTESGDLVNIILVRSPFRDWEQERLYARYKKEILFLGISSFEDFPLPPPNPFSEKFPADKYVGLFPGFLNMFRDTSVFPSDVKLVQLSQSDFALPEPGVPMEKKYDFVFSGTDQDVLNDCVGWSSFAKNWTFVLQALEVMCSEFHLTGVLVATMAKPQFGDQACSIPKSCEGKVLQTRFLDQGDFFSYVKQSHFAFVPQVHDASPRAAAQALALNTPVFMNWHLIGGWKYVNSETGEFFHDMSDFRGSLQRILRNAKAGNVYKPRDYMLKHYGDEISGARLKNFVQENFKDRVTLPKDCRLLIPSGA
jgi:hypothetical protein